MAPNPQPPHTDCQCTHSMGLHRPIGTGSKRRHGPCTVGAGPKGVVCPCPGYRPAVTS